MIRTSKCRLGNTWHIGPTWLRLTWCRYGWSLYFRKRRIAMKPIDYAAVDKYKSESGE